MNQKLYTFPAMQLTKFQNTYLKQANTKEITFQNSMTYHNFG